MITDKNKSHHVYIKDFNRFMCNKTKIKIKNTSADIFYNVLVAKSLGKTSKNLFKNKW